MSVENFLFVAENPINLSNVFLVEDVATDVVSAMYWEFGSELLQAYHNRCNYLFQLPLYPLLVIHQAHGHPIHKLLHRFSTLAVA